MQLRRGMTYRLYDGERFTVSFGTNYIADGSHRRPLIVIIDRQRFHGERFKSIIIPLPHVRFYRCFRFRRLGALKFYGLWHRGMRRLCLNPDYRKRVHG